MYSLCPIGLNDKEVLPSHTGNINAAICSALSMGQDTSTHALIENSSVLLGGLWLHGLPKDDFIGFSIGKILSC